MWIKEAFLGAVGLASGLAVAAGLFSFIIFVGIIPRIVGKSRTARDVMAYEDAALLGASLGNLISVFGLEVPLGTPLIAVYGISAGIFTGCLAVALAEILNAFPILFRRFRIKEGLSWVLFFMALGKALGSLYFYFNHMQQA